MSVELIASEELQGDLALTRDRSMRLFSIPLSLPAGDRVLRVAMQGGAYLNWHQATIGLTLRFDIGQRVLISNAVTTGDPGGTGDIPPTFASGMVVFTGMLDDEFGFMPGMAVTRMDNNMLYAVQQEVWPDGGRAVVPVQSMSPGSAGNAPAGTLFSLGPHAGMAETAFTGGDDFRPGPNQLVYKLASSSIIAEFANSTLRTLNVDVTDIATRNALPGVPMPTTPWMLMGGATGTIPNFHRWPWRCTVEDLN